MQQNLFYVTKKKYGEKEKNNNDENKLFDIKLGCKHGEEVC